MVQAAKKEDATITHVLTTHHHGDHAGGNEAISKMIKDVKVLGGDERIPALNTKVIPSSWSSSINSTKLLAKVGDGDNLEVGNIKVNVFFTPCHTKGHVLYLAKQDGEEVLIYYLFIKAIVLIVE